MTPPTIAPTPGLDSGAVDDAEDNVAVEEAIDPAVVAADVAATVGRVVEMGEEEGRPEEVEVGFSFWVVPSLKNTPRPLLQHSDPREPSPQQ